MNIIQLYKKTGKKGSLKWIFIILIAIVVASYFFDFDVQEAIEDEQTQSNLGYLRDNITLFYQEHLQEYVEPIFNFLRESLLSIINGESSGIENLAPIVNIE